MRCPKCSTDNTDDSKFCMTCGERLVADPVVPAGPEPNPWLDGGPAAVPAAEAPMVDTVLPPPPVGDAWEPPVAPEGVPESLLSGAVAVATPPDTADAVDPYGLEEHLARMSEATRPHAEVPMLLAAVLLDASETVAVVVPGLIDDIVGVAVVTDKRVLLVNGRRWNPTIAEFPISPGLVVEGWQDTDTAMLTFIADRTVRISAIVDKPLAFEAARVVRERVAATAT